jgi:hypothetical protein
MKCKAARREVARVAAGRSAKADMEAHLAVCASCREFEETTRRLSLRIERELGEALAVDPSSAFSLRTRRKIDERIEERRGGRRRLAWWTVPAAASAAALALAGILSRHAAAPVFEPAASVISAPSRAPVSASTATEIARLAPPARHRRIVRRLRRPERPPAVLVDPRERAALELFVARWSSGEQDDLARLLWRGQGLSEKLSDLAIAPIEISELKFDEPNTKERP